MTQTFFKTQNQFTTTITSAITSASGTIEFTLANAPLYPYGFITLSNTEIGFYEFVSGTTIRIAGKNRFNGSTHEIGDNAQIRDVAQMFNLYSEMVATSLFVFAVGDLTVRTLGGPTYVNGTLYDLADTDTVLPDNATRYLWFRISDRSVQLATSVGAFTDRTGVLLATITTLNGTITNIVPNNAKLTLDIPTLQGTNASVVTSADVATDCVILEIGGVLRRMTIIDLINISSDNTVVSTSNIGTGETIQDGVSNGNIPFKKLLGEGGILVETDTGLKFKLSFLGVADFDSLPVTNLYDGMIRVTEDDNLIFRYNLGTLSWDQIGGRESIIVENVSSLPASGAEGEIVCLTTDDLLYFWNGASWLSLLTSESQIIVQSASSLPGTGTAGQLFFQLSDNILYGWDGSAWKNLMAQGVTLGSSLPGSGTEGQVFYNTTDKVLYYWNNTSWIDLTAGGGGASALSGLSDVTITALASGHFLRYNGSAWVNVAFSELITLGSLSDVTITTPTTGDIMRYNGSAWVNVALAELLALTGLSDVAITSATTGDIMRYNGSAWVNIALAELLAISNLSDVLTTTPADGDVLTWNAGTSRWENSVPTATGADRFWDATVGTGGDYATIQLALAAGKMNIVVLSNITETVAIPNVGYPVFIIGKEKFTVSFSAASTLTGATVINFQNLVLEVTSVNAVFGTAGRVNMAQCTLDASTVPGSGTSGIALKSAYDCSITLPNVAVTSGYVVNFISGTISGLQVTGGGTTSNYGISFTDCAISKLDLQCTFGDSAANDIVVSLTTSGINELLTTGTLVCKILIEAKSFIYSAHSVSTTLRFELRQDASIMGGYIASPITIPTGYSKASVVNVTGASTTTILIDGDEACVSMSRIAGGITLSATSERCILSGCQAGTTGGVGTITVQSGATNNIITSCITDDTLSNSGTGTILANNIVV